MNIKKFKKLNQQKFRDLKLNIHVKISLINELVSAKYKKKFINLNKIKDINICKSKTILTLKKSLLIITKNV